MTAIPQSVIDLDLRPSHNDPWQWEPDFPPFPARVLHFIRTGVVLPKRAKLMIEYSAAFLGFIEAMKFASVSAASWQIGYMAHKRRRLRSFRRWHWGRILFWVWAVGLQILVIVAIILHW